MSAISRSPRARRHSATLGDTINADETRYYQTYYRDPTVLGGCPSASTFNSTQGLAITWLP